MDDPAAQETIKTLRERVNEVDHELVRLLNERAQIVQEMGAYKQDAGIPLFDPKREEELLSKIAEDNPGPIYDSSMRDIFENIMHRIRDLEIQRNEFPD